MPRAPEYIPGAALYAREPLQFSGVVVPIGGLVPDRPERQRRKLWSTFKATHNAPLHITMTRVSPGENIDVRTPQQRKKRR